MKEIEIDPNSIEDFESKQPVFQVCVFKYDEDDKLIDSEFVSESADYDESKKRAESLTGDPLELSQYFDDGVAYVGIEVEEVVKFEDGYEENQGSLYIERVINPKYEKDPKKAL